MGATSIHFTWAELACPHCGANNCQQSLLDVLEKFRSLVNKPVKINSAYRCAEHNLAVGGVPDSEHVQGIAADITVEGMTAAELEKVAQGIIGIGGIGRSDSPSYIHIDTRKVNQGRVFWCYAEDGKWCHYFPPFASSIDA